MTVPNSRSRQICVAASRSTFLGEAGASLVSQLVLTTVLSLVALSSLGFVNNTWANREANRARFVGRIADTLCRGASHLSGEEYGMTMRFDPSRLCCAYEMALFPIRLPCE